MEVLNIYATEEHYKLCILEHLLENKPEYESIVSWFIDCIIDNDQNNADNYLEIIKKGFSHNNSKLKNIIATCYSIANQTPLSITIEIYKEKN
jgi:hypothetical protein